MSKQLRHEWADGLRQHARRADVWDGSVRRHLHQRVCDEEDARGEAEGARRQVEVVLHLELRVPQVHAVHDVEHVANPQAYLDACRTLLKPGGIMICSTLNRNPKSFLMGIIGAEYVMRWLPIGTHDWDKFLTPQDLEIITSRNNFISDETVGMKFNLFSKKWSKSSDSSVNYISTFLKN